MNSPKAISTKRNAHRIYPWGKSHQHVILRRKPKNLRSFASLRKTKAPQNDEGPSKRRRPLNTTKAPQHDEGPPQKDEEQAGINLASEISSLQTQSSRDTVLVQIKFFRYLIALSLSLLAIIVSPYANANALLLPMSPKELKNSSFSEYLETFKDVVEFNYSVASKIAPHMPIEDLVVGNTYFLPFGVHSPGQPNIDFFSGRQKNIQAISSGAVSWRPKKKGYRLKNRGYGKYVYGLRDAAKGIVVGDKVFLHDGNTRGLSSLYLGATHMAIKITGKYPDPSIEHIIPKKEQVIENPEFRDYLASLGKLMLWDANAEKIEELPSWVSVTDNPWRALSVIHRLKVRTLYTGRKQTIKSIRITDKEPNIPAAAYVKLNGEPDFIEVLMGMALKIGGFQLSSIDLENYDPSFDDTAYFKHCLQRGLRTHHEAWEVLKALEIANVPYIPQHLVLTSSKDVLQLLRSHHRTLQFEEKCLAALAEKPKKKSK